MKLHRFTLALTLLAALLSAQLSDTSPTTQADCKAYMATPLPPEAAQIPSPNQWPDCDSTKLYAGIGHKVDYTAARKCAWSERLAIQAGIEPQFTVASVLGGPAMLSVLYANGQGVQRSYPLAIRFACEAGGAPAEIAGRIQHLELLRAKSPAANREFTFCDDITSGFMEGFCAAYSSDLADQKRADDLNALVPHLTPAQRSAFETLRATEEKYALAHAKGEIDLSGTARAMFQVDAEQTLRDDFLAALQAYESGTLPTGTAKAYREADAILNSTYRKALGDAEAHKAEYGAVQPEGIRDAERAWLKYRDAWVAFAKLRYPAAPAEAWLTLLTNDRTSILNGSFCSMDAVEGSCAPKGDTWTPSPLP
jgi:uncharacterized protein YecT (DUF1311 family)